MKSEINLVKMMIREKMNALRLLMPGAQYSIRGDDIFWHDSRPQPSDVDVDAMIEKMRKDQQAKEIKIEYKRRIFQQYPFEAQLNNKAKLARLCMAYGKDGMLSFEDQKEWAELLELEAWVEAMRITSNQLEHIQPAYFSDNIHWPL